MHWEEHVGAGLLTYCGFSHQLIEIIDRRGTNEPSKSQLKPHYARLGSLTLAFEFDTLALLEGVGAASLAMLSDVDQRIPGLTHRGATHTVWFALAVSVVLALAGALAVGNAIAGL